MILDELAIQRLIDKMNMTAFKLLQQKKLTLKNLLLEPIFVKKTSGDRKMKTFLLLRKEEGSRLRKKGQ